jgi:cytochrome c5
MSNTSDTGEHSAVSTPKQFLWLTIASFVVPIFVIIGLVYFVTNGAKPSTQTQGAGVGIAGTTGADIERDTLRNIQKVGTVEIKDANKPLRTGEEVFKMQCTTCHTAGVAGAPKFGDAGAWGPRIATGYEALLNSALHGKNAMGAQGGGEFEDIEVGRAVVYMANHGGANFPVPEKPAAAGAVPAASAAK